MRTIIAGSRSITDIKLIYKAVKDSNFIISEVVCGGARGVDSLGRIWAEHGQIPVKIFNADWNKFGKSAGFRRNVEMANYSEALIAIWDGKSRGTKHMIEIAEKRKLILFISLDLI